jgi:hypothetical protein
MRSSKCLAFKSVCAIKYRCYPQVNDITVSSMNFITCMINFR